MRDRQKKKKERKKKGWRRRGLLFNSTLGPDVKLSAVVWQHLGQKQGTLWVTVTRWPCREVQKDSLIIEPWSKCHIHRWRIPTPAKCACMHICGQTTITHSSAHLQFHLCACVWDGVSGLGGDGRLPEGSDWAQRMEEVIFWEGNR